MFHTLGIERNLTNLLLLTQPYVSTSANRVSAYVNYLSAIQPGIHRGVTAGPEFVTSPKIIDNYIEVFSIDGALNDLENIIERNAFEESQLELIRSHHRLFCQEHPELGQLFNLVIRAVFCARSRQAGGGTTSAAIGVLWCDPRPSWSKQDFFEFFVHELTHTLLFLDERVYRHYQSLEHILKTENYIVSAILNRPRPLDKVLHSLLVAAEVLLFRDRTSGHAIATRCHPPTDLMLSQVRACIADLSGNRRFTELCTSRGVELVKLVKERISTLSWHSTSALEMCHG